MHTKVRATDIATTVLFDAAAVRSGIGLVVGTLAVAALAPFIRDCPGDMTRDAWRVEGSR